MPVKIVKPTKVKDMLSLDECIRYLQTKSTKNIIDNSMLQICLDYKELLDRYKP